MKNSITEKQCCSFNVLRIYSSKALFFTFAITLLLVIFAITIQSQDKPEQNSTNTNTNINTNNSNMTVPSPTPDQETVFLQKEKLKYEIKKLEIENANSVRAFSPLGLLNWFFINSVVMVPALLAFAGLFQYLLNRRRERRNREEERFEEITKRLGGETEQERIGAAVLLSIFLEKKYRRFYQQVFNLAAGNLRLVSKSETPFISHVVPSISSEEPSPKPITLSVQTKATTPESALTHTLSNIFLQAYKRAREELFKKELAKRAKSKDYDDEEKLFSVSQSLNAEKVQMNGTYLAGSDLEYAWLREASMVNTNLLQTNFYYGFLEGCDMSNANLSQVNFTKANVEKANFMKANLSKATFDKSIIKAANFEGATLDRAIFINVDFGADFDHLNLRDSEEIITNIQEAETMINTMFFSCSGLTGKQKLVCEEKGAIFSSDLELDKYRDPT